MQTAEVLSLTVVKAEGKYKTINVTLAATSQPVKILFDSPRYVGNDEQISDEARKVLCRELNRILRNFELPPAGITLGSSRS